jgi:hypothetical protein
MIDISHRMCICFRFLASPLFGFLRKKRQLLDRDRARAIGWHGMHRESANSAHRVRDSSISSLLHSLEGLGTCSFARLRKASCSHDLALDSAFADFLATLKPSESRTRNLPHHTSEVQGARYKRENPRTHNTSAQNLQNRKHGHAKGRTAPKKTHKRSTNRTDDTTARQAKHATANPIAKRESQH